FGRAGPLLRPSETPRAEGVRLTHEVRRRAPDYCSLASWDCLWERRAGRRGGCLAPPGRVVEPGTSCAGGCTPSRGVLVDRRCSPRAHLGAASRRAEPLGRHGPRPRLTPRPCEPTTSANLATSPGLATHPGCAEPSA